MPKDPPKFVTDEASWAYTLSKLAAGSGGGLTEEGNPRNYAAAIAIYKNVLKKYGYVAPDAVDELEVATKRQFADRALVLGVSQLTWVPVRGVLVASGPEANYMLSPKDEWVDDQPKHRWRLSIADAEGTASVEVPVATAAFVVKGSDEAREEFEKRTGAMVTDIESAKGTVNPQTVTATKTRLDTLREVLTGVMA